MATYYVSTTGNDSADGSFATPWLTWEKAFTSISVQPGDTVYFRGGIYPTTINTGSGLTITRSGTAGNLINYWAYPADWTAGNYPISDGTNIEPTGLNSIMFGGNISYIHFKGLHVRNVKTIVADGVQAFGWRHYGANNVIWENCVAYNIEGSGFNLWGQINTYFINCDAYNCSDWRDTLNPGNSGTGFSLTNSSNDTSSVYYLGCRAWLCGDQGFSTLTIGYHEYTGCWSFNNGSENGGGHGWKLGWTTAQGTSLRMKINGCIASNNRYSGFTTNDNTVYTNVKWMEIDNNIAYHNGYHSGHADKGWGIIIYNTAAEDEFELLRIFRNNISYDNAISNFFINYQAVYTHSNNTWDIPLTLSDNDFVSIDSSQLLRPRKSDGSLPDITFLKPKSTSPVINAGINVGLTTDGTGINLWNNPTPSIGAFEYAAEYQGIFEILKSRINKFSIG